MNIAHIPRHDAAHDLVSDLLHGMRFDGLHYNRIQITAPFGIEFGGVADRAVFHFVVRNDLYLRRADGQLLHLRQGDAVLLPRGGRHGLVSGADISCVGLQEFVTTAVCPNVESIEACDYEACEQGGVLVFSGCMTLDLGPMHPLVGMMPEIMHVGTLVERNRAILPMLESMAREAAERRAGYGGILTRLAEVVSAALVRDWVEHGCGDTEGWSQALRDPRLGRVISAIHREPGRDWTVAGMAGEMGVSRSVFAERFLTVTGMTPLRYVTELRMRLATQWMGRDGQSIDEVANRLGYGSQAAFSRAFKRTTGRSPGMVRMV